jgi:hypothetical protein
MIAPAHFFRSFTMKPERDDNLDTDDRPRKRKKKKKATQTNWTPIILIAAGGGVLFTLVLIGVVVFFIGSRANKEKLTPVAEFVNFDSPEDVFHVDLPKGWPSDGGGKKGITFVSAMRGSASIKVNENIKGSLAGDMAESRRRDGNIPDEELPVSQVHEMKRSIYADEYRGYAEEPAVTIRNGFGKTRRSTFTGKAGFTKVKGYRATALGVQTQITVTCVCAETDWDICEPAFARVVDSLGYGPGKSDPPRLSFRARSLKTSA